MSDTSRDSAHLHLSDEEFRSETIYFIVTDRFNQGKKNPAPASELDDPTRQDWNKYWGGDLQGIIDKLDYLSNLGVTALWLTPLFEQVEATSLSGTAPMHGYWTKDFKRINSRWVNDPKEVRLFAENTVLDRLIEGLHRRGMKFILDIVCNHSSPATSQGKGKLYDDGRIVADFDNDHSNWYHHYGDVTDWNDQWQVQNAELAGLATFNENNLEYRRYITEAIKLWLDKGVDALRIDTVKHMPNWFWQEFTSEMSTHKPNTFIIGEWIHNHPANELSVEFANVSGMTVFDFGLGQAIRDALAGNSEGGFTVVQDIFDRDGVYRFATDLITMYENHDMPRLQSLGASNEMLELATVLIMTARGIPCLYYGCEQHLHDDTNGGNDPYNRPMMSDWNESSSCFKLIQALAAVRKNNLAVQWGGLWKKIVERDLYVFVRKYREARVVVILNKGVERTLDDLDTELPSGDHTCRLTGETITVTDGRASGIKIGSGQARVFSFDCARITAKSVVLIQANGIVTQPGDKVLVTGNCPELGAWDLTKAVPLEYINGNMWFGEIGFNETAGQSMTYKLVVLHASSDTPPVRENRIMRRRPIAAEGVTKWRDVWER